MDFYDDVYLAIGLIALAGASTNNVKRRNELQRIIDKGVYDDILQRLGMGRESFIDTIDGFAASIARHYQRN